MEMKKTIELLIMLAALAFTFIFMSCASKELTSAKLYISQNNYDMAIQNLELAVQNYTTDPEAPFLLGECYGNKSQWEKMSDMFNKSLSISPRFEQQIKATRDKYYVNILNLGVSKVNSKSGAQPDYDSAVESFSACTIIEPKRPEAYRNLAVTYLKKNNLPDAKNTYLKLLEVDPKNIAAINEASRLMMEMKDYAGAVDMSVKAMNIDPANAEAISSLAMAYDLMGDKDKAQATYVQAIEKNPNNQDLLFNLARLHFLNKEYDKSIELFQKVISLNPEDFESNLNVGNAYLTMADETRKMLVEKENKKVAVTEQELKQLKDFYRASIPFLEKANSVKSDNHTVWYNLGVAYVNIGNTQKGQECFDKAEELRTK